ncbi:AAWKG family protein, partial [Streptomyces sp. NPDC002308]
MADDDWGRSVRLLTGYEVPDRATLFDELKGSDGKTPLLNVKIENVGLNVSLHDLGGQVGANADGHAFVLPYYTPQGSGLNLHKISIDFLWNPGERPSQGPGMPLDNFIFGSQVMLEALAGPPFSTEKLGFGGLSVPDNGAVVLKTFSDIAGAFDRTAEFFTQHEAALKEWLDSFGKDDASWKGNAAGAFHDVLATLHRNYGDYKEQLVPPGFSPTNFALYPVQGKGASSTKQGDTLVGAANEIHQASWELSQAWHQWAADPDSNAMGIAARLINEVAQWVQDTNLTKTGLHNQPSGGMWSGPNVPPTTVVAMPGFTAGHPVWGDLSNIDAWANIGTHSVWQWNQKVQGLLGDPARTQVSNVNNALIQASEVVGQGFKTLNTTSISTYQGSQGSEGGNGGLDDITKGLNDSLGNFSNNLNDSLGNVSDNLGSGLGSFSDNLNDSLGSASDNLGSGLGSFSDNLNDSL